jgi:hypothetical protein
MNNQKSYIVEFSVVRNGRECETYIPTYAQDLPDAIHRCRSLFPEARIIQAYRI